MILHLSIKNTRSDITSSTLYYSKTYFKDYYQYKHFNNWKTTSLNFDFELS